MTLQNDQSLAYYQSHFDNNAYQAVQKELVCTLCGNYQAEIPQLLERALNEPTINGIMNLITDTALEAASYEPTKGKHRQLISALCLAQTKDTDLDSLVNKITDYLKLFDKPELPFSEDFKHTALAALKIHRSINYEAKAHTAAIHNLEANIANELLWVASSAEQLARKMLEGESSQAYIFEKLNRCEEYLRNSRKRLEEFLKSKENR